MRWNAPIEWIQLKFILLDKISPPGPATLLEIKNVAPEGKPKVYEENQFELDPLNLGIPYQETETGTAVSQAEENIGVFHPYLVPLMAGACSQGSGPY